MRPDELRNLIRKQGLTQEGLAMRLGKHRMTVNRWLNGHAKIPIWVEPLLRTKYPRFFLSKEDPEDESGDQFF